jgi:hypothetical protein
MLYLAVEGYQKKMLLEINYLETATKEQVYAEESLDLQAATVLCRRIIVTLHFRLLYFVLVFFHYSHSKSL